MAFWLEQEWQCEAVRQIEAKLTEINVELLPQSLGNADWTKSMLSELAVTLKGLCPATEGEAACGFGGGGAVDHRKAWLYDLSCWVEGPAPEKCTFGLPFAVESEWGGWGAICDDFDKLTQARAGLRVMIFQCSHAFEAVSTRLFDRAKQFRPRSDEDAWLLAGWSRAGFKFRSSVGGVIQ